MVLDRIEFEPLYPRVALLSLLGTPALLLAITISRLLAEFGQGVVPVVLRVITLASSLFLLARLSSVSVVKTNRQGLEVKNPIRTHRVSLDDVASVRTSGHMYKWLVLELAGGSQVPVAASFFVGAPTGSRARALHKFLAGLSDQR